MSPKSGQESEIKVDRDKQKRIKESIAECEKLFDRGAVMQLGNAPPRRADSISTGSLLLDSVIGCGGLPQSYMTEIFGPEGGGKTTLCLQAIAEAQKLGLEALYIDAENKLNLQYAEHLGVNVKSLLVSQPEYGEAGFQIAEIFIKNAAVGIVIVDSIAAMVPKAEFEGEIGDAGYALLARMVTQALRKLKDEVRKSRVAMVFINQLREKMGVTFSHGPTETTPAGRALKHQCSVRMDIRRIAALKIGEKVVGARTKAKIVKNTFAAPFQECEYDLFYGEGISREAEVIDLGVARGIIEKSGTWHSYGGERIGQGREASRVFLKQNPEVFNKIYSVVRKAMFDGKA